MLQPYNPFSATDLPEAIRYLNCAGSETHISQCQIDQEPKEDCGLYEVAGIACQGVHQLECPDYGNSEAIILPIFHVLPLEKS